MPAPTKEPVLLSFSPHNPHLEEVRGQKSQSILVASDAASMKAITGRSRLEDYADSITDDDPEFFGICTKDEIMKICKEFMTEKRHKSVETLALQCLKSLYKGRQYPTTGNLEVLSDYYQNMSTKDTYFLSEYLSVLFRSKILLGRDLAEVMLWVQELDVLYRNIWYSEPLSREHEWAHSEWIFKDYGEHVSTRFSNLVAIARVFGTIHNTAAYAHYMNLARRRLLELPRDEAEYIFQHVGKAMLGLRGLRHPDPAFNPKFELDFPQLQVRGLWKKLGVKVNDAMGARHSAGRFIWKGYFYIVGGVKMGTFRSTAPECTDVWRLNLSKQDGWEFVSRCPKSIFTKNGYRTMLPGVTRVYKDRIYIFHGHPSIIVFDLKTKEWNALGTTFQPTTADKAAGIKVWPWHFYFCQSFCLEIIRNRMFVFGGTSYWTTSGSNLFMELNLDTLKWRRIGGYADIQQYNDPHMPGPRHFAASWVGRDERFYLFSGVCDSDKKIAVMPSNRYAPGEEWTYDDMWSWDLGTERWRREVGRGNMPSPRSDVAYAYNEKLDQFVIFGGVNKMWKFDPEGPSGYCTPTFYADTFVYDRAKRTTSSPPDSATSPQQEEVYRWRHVITYGFPAYRHAAQLACDPETGKIYMCGGKVMAMGTPHKSHTIEQVLQREANQSTPLFDYAASIGIGPDKVPALAKPALLRLFGDVWQLHLDIPGGDFEGIDLEYEVPTAPVGPWQRCFGCKGFGFFRKCGGTCGGRAFFCSTACQRKGWAEHRRLHSCRKA